ncbi:MAG: hypothetical protein R3A13_02220 [Bdellovibrionota bacterium]
MKKILLSIIFSLIFTSLTSISAFAENTAFLPTWKMLNDEEKQHFISGYLYAWQDASSVTDIAIGFIKDNPKQAVKSLESIKGLYNVAGIRPMSLASEIDEFYKQPENKDASLSKAVSYAKSRAN